MCSLSPHLDRQHHQFTIVVGLQHHHHRAARLGSRGCMASILNGICARRSVTPYALLRLHRCAWINRGKHADIHTRRLICIHNFGTSCSSCSSSASRLLVPVRAQILIPNLASIPKLTIFQRKHDHCTFLTGSLNLYLDS